MSTQTLKARPGGAREAQSASVELPEKLSPCRSKLAGALTDYEKAAVNLEEARGHLARAESDEQTALNNAELSDAECSDRVAVAQRSRGIYSARMASREAAVSKLLKLVKDALYPARNEYSGLCMNEREKREAIITARIVEAGQLVGGFAGRLNMLLEYSSPIQDIHALDIPSQSVLFCDNAAQIIGIAKRILEGFAAVAAKKEETI
jgi:hypothetical protein